MKIILLFLSFFVFGRQAPVSTRVSFQKWSPDGQWFAYCIGKDGKTTLKVLRAKNSETVLETEIIGGVDFSADSKFVRYISPDRKLFCRNLVSNDIIQIEGATKCAFSLNGRALILLKGKQLQLIDLRSMDKKSISDGVVEFTETKGGIYFLTDTSKSTLASVNVYSMAKGRTNTIFTSRKPIRKLKVNESNGYAVFMEGEAEEMTYLYMPGKKLLVLNPKTIRGFPTGGVLSLDIYARDLDIKNLVITSTVHVRNDVISKKMPGALVWNGDEFDMSLSRLSFKEEKIDEAHDSIVMGCYSLEKNEFKPSLSFNDEQQYRDYEYMGNRYVMYFDPSKYRSITSDPYKDVYLIDVKTGERWLIAEKFSIESGGWTALNFFRSLSPDGNYFCYYLDKAYWVYDIRSKKNIHLTSGIGDQFYDILNDYPVTAPAPGAIKWGSRPGEVYLHSAANVYRFNLKEGTYKNLTHSRTDSIVFKIADEDAASLIAFSKPTILSARNPGTGCMGWYRLDGDSIAPIVFLDGYLAGFSNSSDAHAFSYTFEKYDQPPQLFIKPSGASEPMKLYDTDPAYKKLNPGKSELVSYMLSDGTNLKGALYYPFNYDPGKKYPMVVYTYERLSEMLNTFADYPMMAKMPYTLVNFNKNGYFVFTPDIRYKLNDPGISAAACVIAGVNAVLKNKSIDKDNIGLMGHSWGGYQAGFIISQTNLFKAANAGAALTDMNSMYLGIRWDATSGVKSSFDLFERHQARFKGPFYNNLEAYIRNSTVHQVKSMNTPLLIEIGNKDGIVDWTQGMELFNALRRAGKQATLLVYNDEGHVLNKEENIADYAKKQMKFFDYYLKGKAKPDWLSVYCSKSN